MVPVVERLLDCSHGKRRIFVAVLIPSGIAEHLAHVSLQNAQVCQLRFLVLHGGDVLVSDEADCGATSLAVTLSAGQENSAAIDCGDPAMSIERAPQASPEPFKCSHSACISFSIRLSFDRASPIFCMSLHVEAPTKHSTN